MATNPAGPALKGWHNDPDNNRLEYFYEGTKIGHLTASGFSITDNTTARMTDGLIQVAGMATPVKTTIVRLGTIAAVASNGAGAIIENMAFIAPADCIIQSAWRMNISASDVTKGTLTSSASFRRINLITNTAGTGSGTNIVASLNATASAASLVTRSFLTVASTVKKDSIVLASHLTVGAVTADGTDIAASIIEIAYELV